MIFNSYTVEFNNAAGIWVNTATDDSDFVYINMYLCPSVINVLRISESTHTRPSQAKLILIEAGHARVYLM